MKKKLFFITAEISKSNNRCDRLTALLCILFLQFLIMRRKLYFICSSFPTGSPKTQVHPPITLVTDLCSKPTC